MDGWQSICRTRWTDDPAAICDLVGQVLRAAKREGIDRDEINEEVDSVFEVIFDAMQHREGSRAEGDESDKTAEVALDLLAGRLVREEDRHYPRASRRPDQADWNRLGCSASGGLFPRMTAVPSGRRSRWGECLRASAGLTVHQDRRICKSANLLQTAMVRSRKPLASDRRSGI
ncbi:MAG: DUF768 domain-containing protein [Mesorhizobium sp.]|nr:MAG: DUF768 domain-containing protein [Mesorhizobium sp.]RWD96752.1 MAG: DUF768 domain-containing protein [Mesorhizobium sp.]